MALTALQAPRAHYGSPKGAAAGDSGCPGGGGGGGSIGRNMQQPWLRRLLFAPLASLVALLLLEGAARAAIYTGVHLFLPAEVVSWITTKQVVFDPELGWRPRAGFPTLRGTNFQESEEREVRKPKKPSVLRGFALGDSQTHGAGVAEAAAWPSVTERLLTAGGHAVDVVNLGSSGYRSAQVLRLIEIYVLPLDPDFLIVDCMRSDGAALPRDYGAKWAPTRKLLFESRIYRLLWLGVARARGQNTGPMGVVNIEQPTTALEGAGSHAEIMALAKMVGVPLLFVDYPFLGHPIQSYAPADRLPPGAKVVAATAALRASGRPPAELFLEANHLSVVGSEIVGQAVADRLKEELGW